MTTPAPTPPRRPAFPSNRLEADGFASRRAWTLLTLLILAILIIAGWSRGDVVPGVRVTDSIVPSDSADEYPTHQAAFGKGGMRSVADLSERDAIPAQRRELGMVVWVRSEGRMYQLAGSTNTWVEFGGETAIGTNGFVRVRTTMEMLGLSTNLLRDGMLLETYGRDAPEDGGGLRWRYSAADTSTATNLGTVFAGGTGRFIAINWDGDVRAFGVFSGETNTVATQSALDAAFTVGKRVFFPPGDYFFDGPITNWSGVRMIGDEATLHRRFWIPQGDPTTGVFDVDMRAFIHFAGGGSMTGLTIDGGNDQGHTISTFGINVNPNGWYWMDASGYVNQTSYLDVSIAAGPYDYAPSGVVANPSDSSTQPAPRMTRIESCTFDRSCGSSVKGYEDGTRSIFVHGNLFLGYLDHQLYLGGNPNFTNYALPGNPVLNVPNLDSVFSGNFFIRPAGQTRGNGAVKIRNHSQRVVINGNTFFNTNDIAINVDADVNSGGAIHYGPVGPVVIANNVGTVKSFLWQADYSTTNRSSQLLVSGNNVTLQHPNAATPLYIYGVDFDHGLGPSGHTKFVGNTFKTEDPTAQMYMLICADTNSPGEFFFEWKDNTVDGLVQVQPYGKPNILFDGGLVMNLRAPDSLVIPVFFNAATAQPNDLLASGSRPWVFKNLLFYNYGVCFFDNSDVSDNPGSGYNQSLAGHTVELSNIRMYGHPDRNHVLDYRGTSAASYAGVNRITLKDNIGNGVASNTNVARLTQTAINEFWTAAPNSEDTAVAKNTSTTFGKSGQSTALAINAGNGASDIGRLLFQTEGVNRWELRNTAPEHSLQFTRRGINGEFISTPLWLDMDNGFIGINDMTAPSYPLDVRGAAAIGAGLDEHQFLHVRAAAGYRRGLSLESVGTGRWLVVADEAPETGSNAGSDLAMMARSDDGDPLATRMKVQRADPSAGLTSILIFYGGAVRPVGVTNINGAAVLYFPSLIPD